MKFLDKCRRINKNYTVEKGGVYYIHCISTGIFPKEFVFKSLEKPEETYAGKLMYLPAEYYESKEEFERSLKLALKGFDTLSQLEYIEELFNIRLANGYQELQKELKKSGILLDWFNGIFYLSCPEVSSHVITLK